MTRENYQNNFIEETFVVDWMAVAGWIAAGIVSKLAGDTIGVELEKLLGIESSTDQLIRSSVDEICQRIDQIVNQQFIEEWSADLEAVRKDILMYLPKQDTDMIKQLEGKVHILAERFIMEGTKTLGPFMISASMDLVCLRYLSSTNGAFVQDLTSRAKEYADWAEAKSTEIIELAKTFVSSSCSSGRGLPVGDMDPQNYAYYTSQWGKKKHRWSGSENLSVYKGRCEENRLNHYNNTVVPALERHNQIIDCVKLWRSIPANTSIVFRDVENSLQYRCKNHSLESGVIVQGNDRDGQYSNPSIHYDLMNLPENTTIHFYSKTRADKEINRIGEIVIWELGSENVPVSSGQFKVSIDWNVNKVVAIKKEPNSNIRCEIYWHDNEEVNTIVDVQETRIEII
ncbi:hypothetical protein GNP92_13220 [Paenibacillus timonensis]|uniref:hypothetical protein n=1 Tax=Paenibacillus rhizolycopersici TaxID=2780073 RepID=UPI0012D9FF46|nr:hypothetical protein [Paenibacillus timonensis]MUG87296.1 hypothetical protein [Paenibacillus timonensis]